ncbi:MAG: F0F1 ATP synthase subunit A [Pirellulaceae bacterium]|nr:F0F1 ATP synthase subunit A [Pirellulaceae bacterium]
MASALLHIKDSYYFEVPKALWRSNRDSKAEFPEVWVRLDDDFQRWQAGRIHEELAGLAGAPAELPAAAELIESYEHWKHSSHSNHGRPITAYLEQQPWFQAALEQPEFAAQWRQLAATAGSSQWVSQYQQLGDAEHVWGADKLQQYNYHLSGKILIPQPFGTLRNFYESQSGFCISKFMILQLVVAIVVAGLFIWLGSRMKSGDAPRGRLWNLLEAILLFLRDELARPAIGKHDADRFVPLLWTIFLFVLGCNLIGMVPWAGTPTSAWGVTLALALVTFGTVVVSGSLKFGVGGFWLNQIPHMDLPFLIALFIKPAILLIEVVGLFIKHAVLSIRLLANMVAGHMVLISIMGLAFSIEGALNPAWPAAAVAAVTGSALLSCLELFVAFLQAYIFTFLSALFIGAAIHHH